MSVDITKPGEPALIHQPASMLAEGSEIQPYAIDYTQPYPVLAGPGGVALGSVPTDTTAVGKSSQTPTQHDLEWTAGDSAAFAFFFDNVAWTPDDPFTVNPPPTGIVWECHAWASQVRTKNPWYLGYWWPPVQPYGRLLLDFSVDATWYDDFQSNGPGTLITVSGGTGWPGQFVWDLQSTHYPDPLDTSVWFTRTWIQGAVTINGQVTVPGTWYYGDGGARWPEISAQWLNMPYTTWPPRTYP